MKKTFLVGALAGISSLSLAVPLVAQFANAESSSSSQTEATDTQSAPGDQFDPHKGGHVGKNGTREELLTGENAAKVIQAALAAVPGGTIDRVETDAEGDTYEAHMTKSDGSHVTVKFDSSFNVTRVEDGPNGMFGR